MSFSDKAIKYFCNLRLQVSLPQGVSVINPYRKKEVKEVVKKFYSRYFNDNNKRLFILGINPGRFGGGLTGISFTDPVTLSENCGIENQLGSLKELSAKFVYEVIKKAGGTEYFYSRVFISALFPLALLKDNKNFNYYDDRKIAGKLENYIIRSINDQKKFGAREDRVVILGKKNAGYFKVLNDRFKFFRDVSVLDHPRYIMQYRLKQINSYINEYLSVIFQ
ncbi:MAG: hypothetical protein Kow0098_29020 [Ignavibacteriaceae bacterium]